MRPEKAVTDSPARRISPIAIGGRSFTRNRGRTVCYARRQNERLSATEAKFENITVAGILAW